MTTELSRKKRHEQGTIYRISGGIYTSGAECPLSEIPLKDTTSRLLRKYFNAMANLYGIIPLRKADVKNPVLDYEWKGNSDFDYASALFKISSFTNTAVGGIATSYDAAEKRKGKLKKDQTTSIIKKWGKTSTSAITSNITQYAGKIAKDSTYVSIALCGIEIGQDYFDDKKFGEGTAAALAGTIASGVAMSATATALAAFAWPTAAVAGASIVVAMVADYAVRRGMAYINSKRGQDELKQLSANLFDSLIQNPDELNKVVNRIAKDNVMVAEILENEKRAFEKEVEDIIMVGDYNRDVPLIMSKAEYGIA